MKTGIVCEGGGMRGVFTAGVLQALMDAGVMADVLVGVSAGASNGVSYVSGQRGRGYRTNVNYAGDKRYCSLQSYLKTGSIFGMDFIFGELPQRLDPFDYAAFHAAPCDFYAGATAVETGEAVFFGKQSIVPPLTVLRASCSMPMFSPMVEIGGKKYLDGGIAAPIPLQKALEQGCERLLVVLTQPKGFTKNPQSFKKAYHAKYRAFPALVKAMDQRHQVYNRTLQQVWQLQVEGKAVVAAPPEPLPVDRFGRDKDALINAFAVGRVAGAAAARVF